MKVSSLAIAMLLTVAIVAAIVATACSDDPPVTGETIAFYLHGYGETESGIYLVNADGSGLRLILAIDENNRASGLTWSPDGRKIAFDSFVNRGNRDIHVMDADGSNVVRLATHPEDDSFPSWSPDGKRIAFQSERGGANSLFVWMPAEGTLSSSPAPNSVGVAPSR